jgi:hypothetical protein
MCFYPLEQTRVGGRSGRQRSGSGSMGFICRRSSTSRRLVPFLRPRPGIHPMDGRVVLVVGPLSGALLGHASLHTASAGKLAVALLAAQRTRRTRLSRPCGHFDTRGRGRICFALCAVRNPTGTKWNNVNQGPHDGMGEGRQVVGGAGKWQGGGVTQAPT